MTWLEVDWVSVMWWDTSLYYKGLRQARSPSRGGTKVRGIEEKDTCFSPIGKTLVEVLPTPPQDRIYVILALFNVMVYNQNMCLLF